MSATSIILLAVLAQVATAEDNPPGRDQARNLINEGILLHRSGKYVPALQKFTAAYEAYPSPRLWFNIGKVNLDLGRPVEAIDAFWRFLEDSPDGGAVQDVLARSAVSELSQSLGRLQVQCSSSGAEISVDGKRLGVAPLPTPYWVTAGHHQVTAVQGKTSLAIEDVEVTAGEPVLVDLRPAMLAPQMPQAHGGPSRESSTTSGWWLGRKWTWVAGGSAVLLAAGATTFGLLGRSRWSDSNRSCADGGGGSDRCGRNAAFQMGIAADVLWGAAAAAAISAGLLFYVEGRQFALAPIVGSAGGLILHGQL